MAKTAKRRRHVDRLRNRWLKLLHSLSFSEEYIRKTCSFGKSMTSDPFDCGRPGCRICSGKNWNPKERRLKGKAESEKRWIEESDLEATMKNYPESNEDFI